ncbi:hypothetical protein GCM10018772_55540 [Streptomyces fumanus]|uniref:Uncharacterized protein n=1 Tax=Streptomyces fumanus TaxID=67302 RepID=A0A919ARP3_9ACTN|nr:hypothetical protein GCM10018772_55540 [Streptomyces fumanus]
MPRCRHDFSIAPADGPSVVRRQESGLYPGVEKGAPGPWQTGPTGVLGNCSTASAEHPLDASGIPEVSEASRKVDTADSKGSADPASCQSGDLTVRHLSRLQVGIGTAGDRFRPSRTGTIDNTHRRYQ